MRKIGGNLSKSDALRFSDFLLTQGIESVVEVAAESKYEVWARHEDQLGPAREHLNTFVQNPNAPQFQVNREAETLRREQEKQKRERLKLQKSFRQRAGAFGGPAGRATVTIIVLCIVASLLTDFGNPSESPWSTDPSEMSQSERIYFSLTLLPKSAYASEDIEINPLAAVMRGEVWRLVTPFFLHGSPMHLVFNCLFIFSFGQVIERFQGASFFLVLVLVGGVVGTLFQAFGPTSLGASSHAIGASGGALALFSYLWLRPNFEPTLPFRVQPMTVMMVMGFVVLSMLPFAPIPHVANLAHLGGLFWGAISATGPFDLLRR